MTSEHITLDKCITTIGLVQPDSSVYIISITETYGSAGTATDGPLVQRELRQQIRFKENLPWTCINIYKLCIHSIPGNIHLILDGIPPTTIPVITLDTLNSRSFNIVEFICQARPETIILARPKGYVTYSRVNTFNISGNHYAKAHSHKPSIHMDFMEDYTINLTCPKFFCVPSEHTFPPEQLYQLNREYNLRIVDQ